MTEIGKPTETQSRHDIVLAALMTTWMSTTDVVNILARRGFILTPEAIRRTLHELVDANKVQRDRLGRSYYWRIKPTPVPKAEPVTAPSPRPAAEPGPLAPYVAAVERAVEDLRKHAATPPEVLDAAEFERRTADLSLEGLFRLDDFLVDRIVKRAKYDALRTMLAALDGWIEGARSNCEALGHRGPDDCGQTFDAEDIRRMVNDAARECDTVAPYRGGE